LRPVIGFVRSHPHKHSFTSARRVVRLLTMEAVMSTRFLLRDLACVLAICLCAVATSGARAIAQDLSTREDPDLQQVAVAYYVEKYRVEPEEALRRLAIQDRAAGIEDELTRLLGDQYAGIWYDHADRGRMKIGLTRRAEVHAGAVRALLDRYELGAEADTVTAEFSVAELERRQGAIRHEIADLIEAAHALTSYDTRLNKVVVTVLAALPAREEVRLKSLSALSWVFIRRIDIPTLAGEPISCNVTFCNSPLRGGREMSGAHGVCTIAFMARDRINPDQFWALTAGHCISLTGDTTWSARNEAGQVMVFGSTAYFTDADTSGSGGDAGIVSIDPWRSWAAPAPIPAVVVKGSAQTTYNPNYQIRATSFSSIGQILCRTGRTTGTECGEVFNLGADETTWYDGVFYHTRNMGEVDMCGSRSGDSGGPFYKNGRAYGILSSYVSIGPAWCYEGYQGVRGAENLLGVDVLLSQ